MSSDKVYDEAVDGAKKVLLYGTLAVLVILIAKFPIAMASLLGLTVGGLSYLLSTILNYITSVV